MKIAMIGLGRMGMNMAKRLLRGGHAVVAYNRSPEKTDAMVKEEGAIGAFSLGEVVEIPIRLLSGAKEQEYGKNLATTNKKIIESGA